jgi:predicted DNA-binding transcriptional regulator AlpA
VTRPLQPDRWRTFVNIYYALDDEGDRQEFLADQLGQPPSEDAWQIMEVQRAIEVRKLHIMETGLITSDIVKLTGLSKSRIYAMLERGEMPPPDVELGMWRFWDRPAIEEWWARQQRQPTSR